MNFTVSQERAAAIRGKDMIVAAGAGSGKTTVLAERVVRRIKEGASVSDFLIATFTTASAADLREKIGKRLTELSAAEPTNPHYRRQLIYLHSASIGTISSLCLKQVKQSAAVLGIPAESHIGDEALCESLLRDCAEASLDTLCETETEKASVLLEHFASFKNDSGLIGTACELYSSIRSYPLYKDWIKKQVEKCYSDASLVENGRFFESSDGKIIAELLKKSIADAKRDIALMYDTAENEKETAHTDKVAELVAGFERGLDIGYDEFCLAVDTVPARFAKPSKSSEVFSEHYASVKKGCLDLVKGFKRGKAELCEEYGKIAVITDALCTYLTLLDEAFTFEKRQRALLDFADAEQLFFTLIAEKSGDLPVKTSVGRELSARYTDVFIDEYQDISPLQDAIFAVIGEGKRFMVGDAKQSIYGFRNAYPDIFMHYRDTFSDGDDGDTARVFLNENFRCDKSIIDFSNLIFDKIYTKDSADTDYTTERLVFGKNGGGDERVRVAVFENREKDSDEEYEYIAQQISRLHGGGMSFSEMAVLYRTGTGIDRLCNSLTAHGIPFAELSSKEPLLSSPEVMLATALLRTVDNPTEDISLAAVLRSPLFGFTAEELFKIRKTSDSLYADVCSYADGDYPRGKRYTLRAATLAGVDFVERPHPCRRRNTALAQKCRAFTDTLRRYRSRSLITPVHELLMYMYEELHFFAFATAGKEQQYMANLYAFYSLAKSVEEHSYKGLSVFVEYIARLKDSDGGPSSPAGTASDAVSLMTVHKSKGLEFNCVFVCNGGKQLKKGDGSTTVDYKGGISFSLADVSVGTKTETVHKRALKVLANRRATAEELRLLYVAFTRARNLLYVTVSGKASLSDFESRSYQHYVRTADFYMNALTDGGDCFELTVFAEDEPFVFDFEPTEVSVEEEALSLPPLYDIESRVEVTAKYFVSATHRDEDGLFVLSDAELMTDRTPSFTAEASEGIGAAVGTANHAFMQFADFANAESDIQAEAKRLLEKQFITEEQYGMLHLDSLSAFFSSDIYGRLKASRRVYRERRFSTQLDAELFSGKAGENVLLQGVIDCFFENGDGSFTLLDYKTDRVRAGEEQKLIERHGTQLLLYCMYIEKLTGRPVRDAYIYSFALNKAIKCEEIRI